MGPPVALRLALKDIAVTEFVLQRRDDNVAIVTLNRPDKLNAVSSALRLGLIQSLREADADKGVRAIVVTGAGRAFCAGQDLSEAVGYEMADIRGWLDEQRMMYQSFRDLSKPCIAAINGTAAGAGFQMTLCADLRITHAAVKLGQPEVRAGLASIVGSYLMSLHVGLGINVELSLCGTLMSGERACAVGLVNELVAKDEVVSRSVERAKELAALDPVAISLTKRRFRETTQAGFDSACDAGVRSQLEAYATGGPQQIMRSFLNKAA